MKKYILSLALLSLVAFCCINWKKAEEPAPKSALVMYGEAVYQREKCGSCHTFVEEKASKKLRSLDGIGGAYSNLWLYEYLYDPASIVPGSRAPGYSHLHKSYFSDKIIDKLTSSPFQGISRVDFHTLLSDQAEPIAEDLRNLGTEVPKTEVLALIAYLQQIPISEKKQELIRMARLESNKRDEVWRNVLKDSSLLIMQLAADPANINKGRALFMMNCTACHGQQAGGGVGPNLTDAYWLHGPAPLQIANTIVFGVPEKGMISWKDQFSPAEVGQLVAFIQSVRGSHPESAKDPQGAHYE